VELVIRVLIGTLIWALLVLGWELRQGFLTPLPYPHEDDDPWCACEECLKERRHEEDK